MPNCVYCKSENVKPASFPKSTIFNNKEFNYLECRDCEVIFIDPLPQPSDYAVMYAASYHEAFYKEEVDTEYASLRYTQILERFRGGVMLDFGCGNGQYLKDLGKYQIKAVGVEYDPVMVGQLNSKGFGRFFTPEQFEQATFEQPFDMVHLGDVIEHLADPPGDIARLIARLRPGGMFIAEGPLENNFTIALMVRKSISSAMSLFRKSPFNHTPYHISFTNAKNQLALFEQAGLQTERFDLIEAHWPYPNEFGGSLGNRFKFLVARTSAKASKLLPSRWGNRFVYFGIKK